MQVTNPQEGLWTLHVVGTAVPQGPQSYSLVANLPLDAWASAVGADETPAAASWVSTGPSHPNPSRGVARIEYTVARAGSIQLRIRDVTGRLVRAVDAQAGGPGTHRITWDGRDERGRTMPSGIYFYRAEDPADLAPSGSSRSLLLLR